MHKITALLVAAFFIVSCNSNETAKTSVSQEEASVAADSYLKTTGDSMEIPAFEIEVALTPQATEKLAKDNESVIVEAWFTGKPKDTASKEYKELGGIMVNTTRIELDSTKLARFEGIKFSKKQFDLLAASDINVLVNVFSGRKSSPDNLLDCAILSDKMSQVKGKRFTLGGKLISQSDSTISHQ